MKTMILLELNDDNTVVLNEITPEGKKKAIEDNNSEADNIYWTSDSPPMPIDQAIHIIGQALNRYKGKDM